MEPTRNLSRNEKLRLVSEEIDRLDESIRHGRREMRERQTENAQIDFMAGHRGGRSPQERERFNENKRVIDRNAKKIAEEAQTIGKLHAYTEKELKTTLRSWY